MSRSRGAAAAGEVGSDAGVGETGVVDGGGPVATGCASPPHPHINPTANSSAADTAPTISQRPLLSWLPAAGAIKSVSIPGKQFRASGFTTTWLDAYTHAKARSHQLRPGATAVFTVPCEVVGVAYAGAWARAGPTRIALLTWTERMHWKPGAQIVLYEMWGRGIGTARPVTVVDDAADRIALYSHPGAPVVTRGTENRRSLGLSERIELMIRMLDPDMGEFREGTSPDSHVLALTPVDSWHSVMLFWSSRVAVQELVRKSPVSAPSHASRSPASRLRARSCCTSRTCLGRGRTWTSSKPWSPEDSSAPSRCRRYEPRQTA